jgi:hypothetical protein
MQHSPIRSSAAALAAGVVALVATGWLAPARALEPTPDEEKAVKACERKLCTMVLGRAETGPDLDCDVTKTWDRDTLKKGDSSSVSWGFGDARCTVDLTLSRADIIGALTAPKYTVQVPEHEVQCIVEQDGKPKKVVARLAPKLKFKNGKADKIWINLAGVDGPTAVTATVNMAASLEDTLGLFHRSMLKSVNKFLHKKCDERYYADGRPKEEPDAVSKRAAKKAAKPAVTETESATATAPAKPVEKSANPVAADAR